MGDQSFRKMGLSKLSNANLKGSPIIDISTSNRKKNEVEAIIRQDSLER